MEAKLETLNRQQHEAARPRAERVIRLRDAGETWATIGKIIGVSRQRVQALAKAHQRKGKR